MAELHLFDESEDDAEEFDGRVTLHSDRASELARFLTAIEALGHLMPSVEVDIQAPGMVRTFYGYEVDVWTTP